MSRGHSAAVQWSNLDWNPGLSDATLFTLGQGPLSLFTPLRSRRWVGCGSPRLRQSALAPPAPQVAPPSGLLQFPRPWAGRSLPILSLQPVTTPLRNATSSVKPAVTTQQSHLLCGPPCLCPWSSACSDADPQRERTMCAPSPAGRAGRSLLRGRGRADGRKGGQRQAWCHSQGACIRRAPCHLEELGRPRPAERVTSLALESPRVTCSARFGPPREDMTQQRLGSAYTCCPRGRASSWSHFPSWVLCIHCPQKLPATPWPSPWPCARLRRASLNPPQASSRAQMEPGEQPNLNQ